MSEAQRNEYPLDRRVGPPRVRTIEKTRNAGWYRYKGHDIHVSRDGAKADWHITVTGPDGIHAYDGYWGEGAGKNQRAAVLEAIDGACLRPNA